MTKSKSHNEGTSLGILWLHGEIEEKIHVNFMEIFNNFLANKNIGEIEVRICSEGGSFDYGISIFEEVRCSPKPVTTVVQGNSSSMASIIFQAGDKRVITKNSRLMIHSPYTSIMGEISLKSGELKQITESVETSEIIILSILSEKTGKSIEKIKKDIGDYSKTFTAQEAVDYGLADEII